MSGKIIKLNADFFSFISKAFSEVIENANFRDLNLADITLIYKKNISNIKVNNGPEDFVPGLLEF